MNDDRTPNQPGRELSDEQLDKLMAGLNPAPGQPRSAATDADLEDQFLRAVGITPTNTGSGRGPGTEGTGQVISLAERREARRPRGAFMAAAAAIIAVIVGFAVNQPATESIETADPVAAPDVTITGPTLVEVGDAVVFTVVNSGGPIDSYEWTFNGFPTEVDGPTFQFEDVQAGQWEIGVTAIGPSGTSSASFEVQVLSDNPLNGSAITVTPRTEANGDSWIADVAFRTTECATVVYSYSSSDGQHSNELTTEVCSTEHSAVLGQDNLDQLLPDQTYTLTILATTPDGRTWTQTVRFETSDPEPISNIRWGRGEDSTHECWGRPRPTFEVTWDGDPDAEVIFSTGFLELISISTGGGGGQAELQVSFDRNPEPESTTFRLDVEVGGVTGPTHTVTLVPNNDGCSGVVGVDPDVDSDGDGTPDPSDNCIAVPNSDQADNDGDGLGNACDPSPDGDPPAGDG